MKRVRVRSAFGGTVDMLAIEERGKLVYVVAPDAVEMLKSGLTEPVGCPKEDVEYQLDK